MISESQKCPFCNKELSSSLCGYCHRDSSLSRRICQYCKQMTPVSEKVCSHCQAKYQNSLTWKIPLIIAFFLIANAIGFLIRSC